MPWSSGKPGLVAVRRTWIVRRREGDRFLDLFAGQGPGGVGGDAGRVGVRGGVAGVVGAGAGVGVGVGGGIGAVAVRAATPGWESTPVRGKRLVEQVGDRVDLVRFEFGAQARSLRVVGTSQGGNQSIRIVDRFAAGQRE
ncbi:MAG: hypothetical protein IPK72_09915 [Candidatus Eisenbacteria bacterium]|nr:hypothetical protein [Candidatus Eisenbacteria bacterium]